MAKAIKISKRILTLLMKTFLPYRIAKHLGKKKCSLNALTCKWKKKKRYHNYTIRYNENTIYQVDYSRLGK